MSNTINYDSIANQEIKRKFVRNEVYGCHTPEVTYILSRWDNDDAPFTYDDVENYYLPYCEDCGYDYVSLTEEENEDGDTVYRCEDCDRVYSQDEYDLLDKSPQEVYEWYAVSDYLADKLLSHGECVIKGPISSYWGRGCSGQAVLLDTVMSRICEEMEILDGQRYSWASMTA